MTNVTRQRLLDILLSCRVIAQYTAGLDFAAYENSLPPLQARVAELLGDDDPH